MAQSPEYPDLKWIEPHAWGSGRDGKAVRYIVIHYTAGSEHATSAEDGARYNQERRDGTSAHYFVDRDSIVQGVRTRDRANCARKRGNRLGIQYELCGTAQTRAQWLDAASLATLKLAARQVARDCRKYDIPVRRLSVAETRRAWTEFPAGPRGIVGHVDCTYAYPEDGGDHTDPGTHFPWDVFLGFVQAEMEDPMAKLDDDDKAWLKGELVKAIWGHDVVPNYAADAEKNPTVGAAYGVGRAGIAATVSYQIRDRVDQVLVLLGALSGKDFTDEPAIAAAVVAALGGTGRSDAELAAALRAALGDRAAEVGRLLAAA